jgi:UPF0271 protein
LKYYERGDYMKVDINCDYGESYGIYKLSDNEEILKYATSLNVACGFHGGDPVVMDKTVKSALKMGVSVGAHPGYPDLMGFGRRHIKLSPIEAKAYMKYQIGALKGFVESYGGKLQHVKPHGDLYNDAAKDYELAYAIAEAVYEIDKELIFFGISNQKTIEAAKEIGLKTANEVFADREYNDDGTLVSRSIKNSVITDKDRCIDRVIKMVKHNYVETINGKKIEIIPDTICVHGDNEKSLELIKNIRESLEKAGIEIISFSKRNV